MKYFNKGNGKVRPKTRLGPRDTGNEKVRTYQQWSKLGPRIELLRDAERLGRFWIWNLWSKGVQESGHFRLQGKSSWLYLHRINAPSQENAVRSNVEDLLALIEERAHPFLDVWAEKGIHRRGYLQLKVELCSLSVVIFLQLFHDPSRSLFLLALMMFCS